MSSNTIKDINSARLSADQVRSTQRPQAPTDRLADAARISLHQLLSQTIDLSLMVTSLHQFLTEFQNISGLEYQNKTENVCEQRGEEKRNTASYTLVIDKEENNQEVGEITFSRSQRFSEEELFHQEQILGITVHYLKNALAHLALNRLAFHDSLTGTLNRTALDSLLPKELGRADRYNLNLSAIMMDIDHFKTINDTRGHAGGDQILKSVSDTILSQIRQSDLLFRYGGDEFVLLLPNTDSEGATKVASLIKTTLQHYSDANPQHEATSISFGITDHQPGESVNALLERLDQALYVSKRNGRNCISSIFK